MNTPEENQRSKIKLDRSCARLLRSLTLAPKDSHNNPLLVIHPIVGSRSIPKFQLNFGTQNYFPLLLFRRILPLNFYLNWKARIASPGFSAFEEARWWSLKSQFSGSEIAKGVPGKKAVYNFNSLCHISPHKLRQKDKWTILHTNWT